MINLNNKKAKSRFTIILEELVCHKSCDLQNALLLMSKSEGERKNQISQASYNLYDSLKKGNMFSLALKQCPFIKFDEVYVSFVGFAERCGKLENTLVFLKNKCVREEQNSSAVIQASVYPLFVVFVSVAATFGVFVYSNSLFTLEDFGITVSNEIYTSFYLSFCFLILFCLSSFLLIRKMLGTNKLYEAFLATGFLVKGGESLANAVNYAVNILGYDNKEGQFFANAGKKLSYGAGLKNAFELDSLSFSLQRELKDAFFYAENSGGENDVFEKIALWLNAHDEKRRSICLKLLEPFFICGTGIFLLIFLMNIVLPVFTQSTMIF